MNELSNTSINGKRLTWEELAEHHEAEARRLHRFEVIVWDLDRCEHGRHEGDICAGVAGCSGPSKGNPFLHESRQIGYTMGGDPIYRTRRSEADGPARIEQSRG